MANVGASQLNSGVGPTDRGERVTGCNQPVTDEAASVSGNERLSRSERAARWVFAACVALFVLESLLFAEGSLVSRAKGLLDWPAFYFAGLVVGGVAVAFPYSPMRNIESLRIGAIVAICGVVVWVGGMLVFLAVYAVAMSNFD